jgi:hypothetical protein
MEMEMEVKDEAVAGSLVERLVAAAAQLEQAVERMAGREIDLEASFGRSATREAELERLLADAEATIAALKAGRKTHPASVATLVAKDGAAVEQGALDAALVSLSLEQRIAVKSQLMRSGLIG